MTTRRSGPCGRRGPRDRKVVHAPPPLNVGPSFRRVACVRAIAWVIFVLSLLATFFCGYAFLFWAWVTATPLTPAQLARAQYNAYVWAALAVASLVAAVIALVWAIRLGRRKLPGGFDVVPSGGGPPAG